MRKYAWLFFLICTSISCNRCLDTCVHGTCIKKLCSCDVWYESDACNRSVLSRHANVYQGQLRRDSVVIDTLAFSLIVSPSDPSKMLMYEEDIELHFTDHTRFNIPTQMWKGREIDGQGEMLIDLLSMRLEYSDSNGLVSALLEAKQRSTVE